MMKQGKNDMEYDPFVIAQWIAASLTGELSGEEERKLAAWRESSAKHERLYGRLLNEENRRWKKQQFDSFDKESGWKGYKKKRSRERRISRGWIRFARYVAVLLVPLCVALYLWKGQTEDKSVLPVMASHTIEPGGAKASLILSTGDVVDLAATSGAIRVND